MGKCQTVVAGYCKFAKNYAATDVARTLPVTRMPRLKGVEMSLDPAGKSAYATSRLQTM